MNIAKYLDRQALRLQIGNNAAEKGQFGNDRGLSLLRGGAIGVGRRRRAIRLLHLHQIG